jgi:hypothetical protein
MGLTVEYCKAGGQITYGETSAAHATPERFMEKYDLAKIEGE